MKKVNINLLTILIIAGFILATGILLEQTVSLLGGELHTLRTDITTTMQQDEIDDAEGWGLILKGIFYGIGAFGIVLFQIFVVLWICYAGLIIALAIIARCLFSENRSRLLTYRILMGIDYGLLAIAAFVLLFAMPTIATAVIAVILAVLIVLNARNTYSKRILT